MAFNRKRFEELVTPLNEKEIEIIRRKRENRDQLRMSQEIALCIRYYLRTKEMTQNELAEKMGVSAVYVSKLLRGGENLTIETICKVQKALGVTIINIPQPYATYTIHSSGLTQFNFVSNEAVSSQSYCESVSNGYNPIIPLNVA